MDPFDEFLNDEVVEVSGWGPDEWAAYDRWRAESRDDAAGSRASVE